MEAGTRSLLVRVLTAAVVVSALVVVVATAVALLTICTVRWHKRRAARRRRRTEGAAPPTYTTLVVFGSGGHTTEMMRLTKKLDETRYAPLYFIVATTDATSRRKVEATPDALRPDAWIRVPRAREVGQSWATTVVSTARATAAAFAVALRHRPDLVIANGPGTCLPVLAASWLFGARCIFVESWCRVKELSLTGRLVYPWAHRFVVHWPGLVEKYPRAEYLGRIC